MRVFVVLAGAMHTGHLRVGKVRRDPSTGKACTSGRFRATPVWADNFSKNVRIGQVRVLTAVRTDPKPAGFGWKMQRWSVLLGFCSSPISPPLIHQTELIKR